MIRFENVLKRSFQGIFKTSWRCLLKAYELGGYICLDQDVLKTSSEDENKRRLQQDEYLLGNDEIFFFHLGSGAGSWVSIPCILKDTRHIHWLHPPKQSIKKKQKNPAKRSNFHQIISYYLGLHTQKPGLREVDLQPNPKRGSDKINRLRPRRKSTTESKSYRTVWTHKQEPST